MSGPQPSLKEVITELIEEYQSLNEPTIEELREEPSPLEFLRYVHRNRPFVLRRGASDWSAISMWTGDYLSTVLKEKDVNVAFTPHGNADSPTIIDGQLLFVKPYEIQVPFVEALEKIRGNERGNEGSVAYAQTQNDNLRDEYIALYSEVPQSIPFARIALQKDPDAVNLWIGSSKSTTALHKDPYENIYVQIKGRKHFVLLPPIASACVNEKSIPAATYVPSVDGLKELQAIIDEPLEQIPFPTWDPDKPEERLTEFSKLIKPLRVTLNPGDMLYLPALWYHKVSQTSDPVEDFCLAVNYWFDMEYTGAFHSLCSFARRISQLKTEVQSKS